MGYSNSGRDTPGRGGGWGEGRASVGRHPALCDLVIGHPTISARHFRLSAGGDSVYVEDLNSLNGTIVDDRRLAPYEAAAISDGSAVVAGGVALRVERLEG